MAVGQTTAPDPAPARVRRDGGDEGRLRSQALRTFFVAMVASAAITTSSSSFFMAAIVAGDHPMFDATRDRRRQLRLRSVTLRPRVAAPAGGGARAF
jgi:hypothetical protein